MSKRVYIDMDGVICDFEKMYLKKINNNPKNLYPYAEFDFFRRLEPIDGALAAIQKIADVYDTWILTKPSYRNPLCYLEKRLWVEDHLGLEWCKRLIICPDKSLMKGDYLIDDNDWSEFEGELIKFGSKQYPSWKDVLIKLN